jgi:hypothetical protein
MQFGFNPFGLDMDVVNFEVILGNTTIKRETMTAPNIMLQQQFMQAMQEISHSNEPYKIRILRDCYIEETGKTLVNEISFGNAAYVAAFPDEYKEVNKND